MYGVITLKSRGSGSWRIHCGVEVTELKGRQLAVGSDLLVCVCLVQVVCSAGMFPRHGTSPGVRIPPATRD